MHNITPKILSKKNNNKQKELGMLIDLTFFESNEVYGLLGETGSYEAFGIYTAIFVSLRRLENQRLKKCDLKAFAFRLHISLALLEKTLEQIVNNNLLCLENDMYYSPYLDRQLHEYFEKSEIFSEAGKRGAEAKASKRALSESEATLKPPLSHPEARLEPPLRVSNLIQSNLIQSNLTESNLNQDLELRDLDTSTPPDLAAASKFELSEKAKKFASKLKIDLEPKKVEEVPKPTMTEAVTQGENEQNQGKQPDEIEKTTESIDPPKENALMAKFGSFDLPDDLLEFGKAVEAELDTPTGEKPWEKSSQYILAGRRPVKKYPDIWFTPIELAQVAAKYKEAKILNRLKDGLRIVQSRLTDLKAQGKNTEFKAFTGWMLSFVMADLLDKKIKTNILEKQEQRNNLNNC